MESPGHVGADRTRTVLPSRRFLYRSLAGSQASHITHAHGDHARSGSESYLTVTAGVRLLRARLGSEVAIETKGYGESITIGDVAVSFHPAGHILGSAQVRLEYHGEVWVVSGDSSEQGPKTSHQHGPLNKGLPHTVPPT